MDSKTLSGRELALRAFFDGVIGIIEGKAQDKGYSAGGDGGELLYKFVGANFKGHPLGEIVYKAVRYARKGDPADLLKAAAWAFLVWEDTLQSQPGKYVTLTEEGPTYGARMSPADMGKAQVSPDPDRYAPVSSPVAYVVRAVTEGVLSGLRTRPQVWLADPVRLVALVEEEVGEAMKEALNATRGTNKPTTPNTIRMTEELIQAAVMAVTAVVVLRGNHV